MLTYLRAGSKSDFSLKIFWGLCAASKMMRTQMVGCCSAAPIVCLSFPAHPLLSPPEWVSTEGSMSQGLEGQRGPLGLGFPEENRGFLAPCSVTAPVPQGLAVGACLWDASPYISGAPHSTLPGSQAAT